MDKERLEEIENHLDRFMTPANKPCLFREDAEWLISTVKEQQKEIEGLHWRNEWIKSQEEIGHLGASVHDLKQENARLREILNDIRGCSDIPTAVEELVKQALKE